MFQEDSLQRRWTIPRLETTPQNAIHRRLDITLRDVDHRKNNERSGKRLTFTYAHQSNFNNVMEITNLDKSRICRMVGVERFELPTLWSQTRCATRLRYTPPMS